MKFQYLRCRSNDYKILLKREKGKFRMILMKFDIGNPIHESLHPSHLLGIGMLGIPTRNNT